VRTFVDHLAAECIACPGDAPPATAPATRTVRRSRTAA